MWYVMECDQQSCPTTNSMSHLLCLVKRLKFPDADATWQECSGHGEEYKLSGCKPEKCLEPSEAEKAQKGEINWEGWRWVSTQNGGLHFLPLWFCALVHLGHHGSRCLVALLRISSKKKGYTDIPNKGSFNGENDDETWWNIGFAVHTCFLSKIVISCI